MSSSESNEWITPKWLFDRYDSIYHYTTDVCTNPNNPLGCPVYFTKETDGLKNFDRWQGNIWCNPPYGNEVDKWVPKCAEYPKTGKGIATLLIASRTETKRFHKYIWDKQKSTWRENVLGDFLDRRIKFRLQDGNEADAPFFASLAVIFYRSAEEKANYMKHVQNREGYVYVSKGKRLSLEQL